MKTAAEVTQDAFDAYAENLAPDERELFDVAAGNWRSFIEDAIETDRAQIKVSLTESAHPDDWGVPCVYVKSFIKKMDGGS